MERTTKDVAQFVALRKIHSSRTDQLQHYTINLGKILTRLSATLFNCFSLFLVILFFLIPGVHAMNKPSETLLHSVGDLHNVIGDANAVVQNDVASLAHISSHYFSGSDVVLPVCDSKRITTCYHSVSLDGMQIVWKKFQPYAILQTEQVSMPETTGYVEIFGTNAVVQETGQAV